MYTKLAHVTLECETDDLLAELQWWNVLFGAVHRPVNHNGRVLERLRFSEFWIHYYHEVVKPGEACVQNFGHIAVTVADRMRLLEDYGAMFEGVAQSGPPVANRHGGVFIFTPVGHRVEVYQA